MSAFCSGLFRHKSLLVALIVGNSLDRDEDLPILPNDFHCTQFGAACAQAITCLNVAFGMNTRHNIQNVKPKVCSAAFAICTGPVSSIFYERFLALDRNRDFHSIFMSGTENNAACSVAATH